MVSVEKKGFVSVVQVHFLCMVAWCALPVACVASHGHQHLSA